MGLLLTRLDAVGLAMLVVVAPVVIPIKTEALEGLHQRQRQHQQSVLDLVKQGQLEVNLLDRYPIERRTLGDHKEQFNLQIKSCSQWSLAVLRAATMYRVFGIPLSRLSAMLEYLYFLNTLQKHRHTIDYLA